MILIDAHAHIHDCYDPARFFENTYRNFRDAAAKACGSTEFAGALMLAESDRENNFTHFMELANSGDAKNTTSRFGIWSFKKTDEANSIIVTDGERNLVLIAGHQIAAAEDLELLTLGATIKIRDGLPIFELLHRARDLDVLRVIPWGAGKWLFSRGKLLSRIIDSIEEDDFFLGDESGRPVFWPMPHHFKYAARKKIGNLPGTDPLPFPWEVDRAGTFGVWVKAEIDWDLPAKSIIQAVRNRNHTLNCYGVLENPWRFIRNQCGMQMKKRTRAQH